MAIQIQDITDEPHQRHVILFEESEIILILRFHPTVEIWTIDVEYKERQAYGYKLSTGVLHLLPLNLPFDFVVSDQSGSGLDPIRVDDFSTDRCALYMLEAADLEDIRGGPVPI